MGASRRIADGREQLRAVKSPYHLMIRPPAKGESRIFPPWLCSSDGLPPIIPMQGADVNIVSAQRLVYKAAMRARIGVVCTNRQAILPIHSGSRYGTPGWQRPIAEYPFRLWRALLQI